MSLAPAHVVAIGLACFGLGLIAAAFVGEPFGLSRLLLGIGLLVVAMITSGIQLLNRHGAPVREEA